MNRGLPSSAEAREPFRETCAQLLFVPFIVESLQTHAWPHWELASCWTQVSAITLPTVVLLPLIFLWEEYDV